VLVEKEEKQGGGEVSDQKEREGLSFTRLKITNTHKRKIEKKLRTELFGPLLVLSSVVK